MRKVRGFLAAIQRRMPIHRQSRRGGWREIENTKRITSPELFASQCEPALRGWSRPKAG